MRHHSPDSSIRIPGRSLAHPLSCLVAAVFLYTVERVPPGHSPMSGCVFVSSIARALLCFASSVRPSAWCSLARLLGRTLSFGAILLHPRVSERSRVAPRSFACYALALCALSEQPPKAVSPSLSNANRGILFSQWCLHNPPSILPGPVPDPTDVNPDIASIPGRNLTLLGSSGGK